MSHFKQAQTEATVLACKADPVRPFAPSALAFFPSPLFCLFLPKRTYLISVFLLHPLPPPNLISAKVVSTDALTLAKRQTKGETTVVKYLPPQAAQSPIISHATSPLFSSSSSSFLSPHPLWKFHATSSQSSSVLVHLQFTSSSLYSFSFCIFFFLHHSLHITLLPLIFL